MRVYLDTNVVVAAFATRGLCADLFRTVLTRHELVIGRGVLRELERVLKTKLGVPPSEVAAALELLRDEVQIVEERQKTTVAVPDPDDLAIVEQALHGAVDVFVTGDRALVEAELDLPFEMITPRGLWERIREP